MTHGDFRDDLPSQLLECKNAVFTQITLLVPSKPNVTATKLHTNRMKLKPDLGANWP